MKINRYTANTIPRTINLLKKRIYTRLAELDITAYCSREPLPYSRRQSGRRKQVRCGSYWAYQVFDCAWFHFRGQIPAAAAGKPVVLLLDVNGEMCLFDNQGVPLRGLTPGSGFFDPELGSSAKKVFYYKNRAAGGEKINLWADAGLNDLFGRYPGTGKIVDAHIAVLDRDIKKLYYDFCFLFNYYTALSDANKQKDYVLQVLKKAEQQLFDFTEREIKAASKVTHAFFQSSGQTARFNISAVGHAHLDLAWLWPVRETRRKAARTIATVLDLMHYYPDYCFALSQPRLYSWLKQDYPRLYQKLKKKVKAGKIEPQGAAWVECDVNITGAESIVRQLLYGSRFFQKEFNISPDYLWLPDVFGYNAALPQILKKSGLKYFLTQKLSWNTVTEHPLHSFHWQGIDGSKVATHLLPENTYNSPAGPAAVLKTITNYKQKDISSHALMAFGVGNGGGGPGEPHMENLQRLSRTSALPGIKQEWTAAFLKKWSKDSKKFQTYTGELYLEKHQGTFTTQSSVKYYNKKAEAVLRETEYNLAITQEDSFKAEILSIWQDVLLYQFHDILPGSSIKRVYSECFGAYKKLLKRLNEINASLYKKVIKKISCGWQQQGYTAFNSLNWQRSAWFKIRQQWYQSELPAMGFTRLEKRNKLNNSFELKANCNQLENNRIRIKFARDGSLFSVFDKYSKREVLPPRQNANVYRIYRDYGDAWDFDYDYFNKKNEIFILQQSQAWCDGPEAVVKQFYKYKNSSLVLEIKLLADSSRIDFNCRLNWQEKFTMLRTCFPVNVNTDTAVCGIQFGAVKRPTTSNDLTELARDEVPFHKWTDIADTGYGAALLSENKYGIRVKNNILDLNLLRSVPYPYAKTKAEFMQADVKDDEACSDIGSHFFRYAFYPHQGNYCQGEVVKEAYNFNFPPVYSKGCPVEKNRTDFSFMEILQGDIIIEHVKPAENGEGIILRLYEPYNKETEVSVRLNMPVGRVMLTDLMEKNIKNIPFKNNCFTVRFKPFAVKSLRLI